MPHCCFGIVDDNGRIVDAAPIAKYTVGWQTLDAVAYFQRRGAKVIRLGP